MKKLTSRILKKLEFNADLHMHGTGFTTATSQNTDWGLLVVKRTDGSPHYRITVYEVHDSKSGAIANLMTKNEERDSEMRKFVRTYNKARKAA